MTSRHALAPRRPAASARLRRALLGVTALVLLLHGVVLGGAAGSGAAASASPGTAPTLVVRTIEPPPAAPEPAPSPETDAQAGGMGGTEAPAVTARPAPIARSSAGMSDRTSGLVVRSTEAGTDFDRSARVSVELTAERATPMIPVAPAEPDVPIAIPATLDVDAAFGASARADSGFMDVALPANPAPATATFLSEGERPPPVYKTQLPRPAVLRYELRRGFLRGTGEIRWRPEGDRYTLKFDAKVAGLSLLSQTSQGQLDTTGVAPVRFLDQRAGKSQRAANFRRDLGTITFSGPSTQWPLLAGTQDRLSWMIQLSAIVAADPAVAREGRPISMALVSAGGEAGVRSVRFAGRESVETAGSPVPALRFVVDPRGAYDGAFEIWLDPARDYLPVRAASHRPGGEPEFELLLQRLEL